MKAKQMQAQYDAQNKRNIRHRSAQRGMLAGLAAAAAVLVGGAVTAGAVNDWNYAALFSKFFSEKSGEAVIYDFTGMGLDIGQSFAGEGYTLTVQSVIADATAVYTLYDITLDDGILAQLTDEPEFCGRGGLSTGVQKQGENGTYSPTGNHGKLTQISDNTLRGMFISEFDYGVTLSDKELDINGTEVMIVSQDDKRLLLMLPEISNTTLTTVGLSEIEIQPGLDVACSVILPGDLNEVEFTSMYISPMQLTLKRWDQFADSSEGKLPDTPGKRPMENTVTIIYADGTETLMPADSEHGGLLNSLNSYGGYDSWTKETINFTAPIDLDAVVAVRIGETEIPVQ